MANKEKKKSIKAEYDKIRVSGHTGYMRGDEAYVHVTLKDMSYGVGECATQSFTIKEAKEIIGLFESAIKEANKKKEKN